MREYVAVSLPDWRTSTAGSRTRVALWLVSEIGVGGHFTKAQLREAFPAVEQVDRRMRDLRAEGWIIATYREDRSLASDELRLVEVGGLVWERSYRSRAATAVSDKTRKEILAADNYVCTFCGIGGGEEYPDDPLRRAKLTVARVKTAEDIQLQTVCDRCRVSAREGGEDTNLLNAIQTLDEPQLELLRGWVKEGKRRQSPAEVAWGMYRRLPDAARQPVRAYLDSLPRQSDVWDGNASTTLDG